MPLRQGEQLAGTRPYRVVVVKYSGARVLFQAYTTLQEAEAVRDRLRHWRCPCEIESPFDGAIDSLVAETPE